MENNKIGKFISDRRKIKNLTQQELGDKLFVTDKAVSKWERGLSLPDITILVKLADVLETDIYSILQIENKTNIDIDKILKEETIKIKKNIRRKIIIILIPIIIIFLFLLFKLLPFGYNIIPTRYEYNDTKIINLGVPKFSLFMRNVENNYSFKNLRGKSILKSEIRNYLNTLEHISCNNTTYYYDRSTNITIIDYNVNGNLIYNTISYNIRNGNYCDTWQVKEYEEKIGTLNHIRTLYNEESNLIIYFKPNLKTDKGKNEWIASLEVYYNYDKYKKVIEISNGTFEIIDDELIYYRNEIIKHDENIKIPNISKFILKNKKLILKDNYIYSYEKSIILK